ncbi:cell division protein FtsW [bacterium]|nr:cell division protein FtsW [candidate division CSSED10-310 bacterium]
MNARIQFWNPVSIGRHFCVVFNRSNPFIILTVLILTGLGLLGVMTTGRHLSEDPYHFVHRQLMYAGLGILFLFAMAMIDYSHFRLKTQWPYVATIGLLVAVLIWGRNNSWLRLPMFSIQPSEIGKFILILYIAYIMAFDRMDAMHFWTDSLPILLTCSLLIIPTALQPDFGTALVMTMITGYMLLAGGMPVAHLLYPALSTLPAVLAVPILHPYVMLRFTHFLVSLNPFADPSHLSFHDYHMRMAMGNGGILGTGFGNGLVKRSFLPASHTDSIFTVIVEEGGFISGIIVIGLFIGLVWLGESTARSAKDRFGAFLARGITFYLVAQAFLNISVCLGLLPNTGVTLPFLSYGGSSLVVSLAAIGVLINVSSQRQMII